MIAMTDIKVQKLIYHITSTDNLTGILEHGLLPRKDLNDFDDVADHAILKGREAHSLETYVPFHFFAANPFDGRVHEEYPDSDFVLISVRRAVAEARNWQIIPRHPLAREGIRILSYAEGMETIDWDAMNLRDYHDDNSKSVCMAECLSPKIVPVADFFKLFVSNDRVKQNVEMLLRDRRLQIDVVVNRGMFRR